MAFSKKIRQLVYDKYGGHCAYCGREIAYKDMQVTISDLNTLTERMILKTSILLAECVISEKAH